VRRFASFNSLYWDFCSASTRADYGMMPQVHSFNSLYWDFCSASCIILGTSGCFLYALSIPFIGIFALHHSSFLEAYFWLLTFNSLYWDFCSASSRAALWILAFCISFNSLYWDFCSASYLLVPKAIREKLFQFPLLGFLLCIRTIGMTLNFCSC